MVTAFKCMQIPANKSVRLDSLHMYKVQVTMVSTVDEIRVKFTSSLTQISKSGQMNCCLKQSP